MIGNDGFQMEIGPRQKWIMMLTCGPGGSLPLIFFYFYVFFFCLPYFLSFIRLQIILVDCLSPPRGFFCNAPTAILGRCCSWRPEQSNVCNHFTPFCSLAKAGNDWLFASLTILWDSLIEILLWFFSEVEKRNSISDLPSFLFSSLSWRPTASPKIESKNPHFTAIKWIINI